MQATPYTRATSFADDERNNTGGRSAVRTAQVDAELDALATPLNQTIANLALIQRDDGEIRDGMVKPHTFSADVLKMLSAVGTIRGAWVTATVYSPKDIVTQSGNTYVGAATHTAGTFATDLAAGRWILLQLGAGAGAASVPFTPTATIASSNVQAAIAELDTDIRGLDAATDASLRADLADEAATSKGAGQIGFNWDLSYAVGTVGRWLKDLATSAGAALIGFVQLGTGAVQRSVQAELRDCVKLAQFGGKSDGLTDDTAAILAANTYCKANGKTLLFPTGSTIYKPTAPLECGMWAGESAEGSLILVDCSAYTGPKVVFRLTKKSEWRDLSAYEKNGSRANGIIVQLSDTAAGNAAGGANSFTAYTNLRRVWVFGGWAALDVGNMFTCLFDSCMFRQAGIGVRIVPTDDAGDNGYANTLTFAGCEVSENNQNWLVNGVGSQIKGLLVLGGSTERCATTTSVFTNLLNANFIGHYVEQVAAVAPASFVGCTGLRLNLIPIGAQCDLILGTNTEAVVENWNNASSTSRLLGGDGTQTVTLRNCQFPASGNSPTYNFARFSAFASSYNGIYFDALVPSLEAPERNRINQQATVVASAGANDVYLFRDGKAAVQNNGLAGILSITATDTSTSANYCSYVYAITSDNNGAANAALTQIARTLRGTDPGVGTTPFSLAADGAGGAVKVQFTKNAAIASVTVKVQFIGMVA